MPDLIRSALDYFGCGEIKGYILVPIGAILFTICTGKASEMNEGTVGRLTEENSSIIFLRLAGEFSSLF